MGLEFEEVTRSQSGVIISHNPVPQSSNLAGIKNQASKIKPQEIGFCWAYFLFMVVIITNYYLSLSLSIILTRIIMFTIKIFPIGSTIIQRLSVIILTLSGCIVISLVS